MLFSTSLEILNARISIDSIFVIDSIEKGYFSPLLFKEPKGHYTLNPKAIYCGRRYTLGFKLENIDLNNKLNIYELKLSNGITKSELYFNSDLNMIIAEVYFQASSVPLLNETSLPDFLWTMCDLYLGINGQVVTTNDGNLISLPLSFNVNHATVSGDGFYKSNKAFMVIQPYEKIFLDISSGGGGGAGVNFIKGENKSGDSGGDATLCYIEPETGLIKPIVFLEGGAGGRLSSSAHQEFKPRTAKSKVFVEGYLSSDIFVEIILKHHNMPSKNIIETNGGEGHVLLDHTLSSTGGDGGIKDDIGYRGEGGMSGARAIVQIQYKPLSDGLPGPLLILHPKTMVNIFDIVNDKSLKIKKTKKPMLGGGSGFSITAPGKDGLDGNFIVSI